MVRVFKVQIITEGDCIILYFLLLAVPMISIDFYKPTFLSKFIESHIVMIEVTMNFNSYELLLIKPPLEYSK